MGVDAIVDAVVDEVVDAVVDVVMDTTKKDTVADVANNVKGFDTATCMENALIVAQSVRPPAQTTKFHP